MALIRDADTVLADTGPFCRFAEAGHIEALPNHLGPTLKVVQDVSRELDFRRRDPAENHGSIAQLAWRDPKFPESDPIPLTPKQLKEVERIASRWGPGRKGLADHGELATIVVAAQLGYPVLIDEGNGKKLAAARRLVVWTTEDLAVEMATLGTLTDDEAFAVFRRVYGSSRADFDARVAVLRAGIQ